MGRHGLVGVITPEHYGGLGAGVPEYCFVAELVARHGLVSPQLSIQGQCWLKDWGTPAMKDQYLAGIASGELIFSESISEPGAGSSLKLMRSTAARDGSEWVLNGEKIHVNLGVESDVTLVYAIAPEGLTAFLVDTSAPGLVRRHTEPIGARTLPTAEMTFCDVRVPTSAVLGTPGRGLETFFSTFNTSRLGNASELIGVARRALVIGLDYASQRQIGSNVVTDFQGQRWTLAECYGALYGASLARDHAANLWDQQEEHPFETNLAKKLAIDAAERCLNDVFGLVGGYGLYMDQEFGQLLHDVKVLRVAGGSLEVLRNFVAKAVLKSDTYLGLR
jgi:alkylation response protein AidB-like acyl-CoA dehydrogenase